MASTAKIITLFLLSLLFSTSALSRNILRRSTGSLTTSLDVSSSLEKATQAILSLTTTTATTTAPIFDQQAAVATVHSSGDRTIHSLQLHSRDFLPILNSSSLHKDYKSLTLARLQRDQARVSAISSRLELAISGIERSDLKPNGDEVFTIEEATASASGLRGPVVSGSSQGSGEYFSLLNVGTPPKPLYMVLDTGSDVTWVQCQPCSDCYQQSDPIFDPSASSSYSPVACESSSCKSLDVSACRNGTCLYQVSYGDGSYTLGDLATESITFGGGDDGSSSDSVSDVAFGCGHDNEGLFVASAGLLGLGGGALSFPSQIQAKSFSYCLVDRDSPSTSTLDFGSGVSDSSAVTAPLLKNNKLDTFYYVTMTGISVGGEMLSIPPSAFAMDASGSGGIIVDSGTAITRLQSEAYGAMRDAFVKGTTDLNKTDGVALFDTCYDLTGKTSVEVPTVAFHFPEGKELKLPANNYLIPVDSAGTFCLAFAPTGSPLSIIGNVQQQGTRVAFDLENSVVGFTANKC